MPQYRSIAPAAAASNSKSRRRGTNVTRGTAFPIPIRPAPKRIIIKRQGQISWKLHIMLVTVIFAAILLVYTYTLPALPTKIYSGSLQIGRIESDTTATQQNPLLLKDDKTLALIYPPGLMGGYRNQVIRFLALCVHAMNNQMDKILLPSLLWATQVKDDNDTTSEIWVPIPHALLFDVDFWNTHNENLPALVDYTPKEHVYDCWSMVGDNDNSNNQFSHYNSLTKQVLLQGFLSPILNTSIDYVTRTTVGNLRKVDFYPQVKHCTSPIPYGGGKGAGRLWNDYISMLQHGNTIPFQADAKLLHALRPKQIWRDLAMSCVTNNQQQPNDATTTNANNNNYVALHARMELEMMDHVCGKSMERNLTTLFQHVESLVQETYPSTRGVFIAVSRAGMEVKEGRMYTKFKEYADSNLEAMNRIVRSNGAGQGLQGGKITVFECGQQLMDQYYKEHPNSINYGQLLQSVINFYIATEATAFVGVRGSSYSTDIWTTRYHQGKGAHNYEYTLQGIQLMENGGLPPPHTNCKR